MKQGGRFAKKSAGFTIVETLIVLAVSAGLFLIGALYVGGKQAKTEFQIGIRDVQTKLQQIINQTESGYYGTQSKSNCSTVGAGNLTFPASTKDLGTRSYCIFIGKAIVIDSTRVYVYSLAGARQGSDAEDVTTYVAARTTVVGIPETYILPNGITLVSSAYEGNSLSVGPRGFAALSSLANASGSATGSQTFDLYGFNRTFTSPASTFDNTIDAEMYDGLAAYPSKKSVRLCMQSGGTNQSALITVGGNRGLAVRTELKNGTECL